MELRKHPFMSHGWLSQWPPEWQWIIGADDAHPVGEIGLLEKIDQSRVDPNACFLTMSHAGASYVGRLHFDHDGFCHQICEVLQRHYGRPINEIGDLDIP